MSAPERQHMTYSAVKQPLAPLVPPSVEPEAVAVKSSPMKQKVEAHDNDAESSDLATKLLTPVSGKSGKEQRMLRVTKYTRALPHTPMSNIGSLGDAPVGSRRFDFSLELLTKRFIAVITSAKDGIVDLNQVAVTLKAEKRRLYDITHVLEGIGLMEKKRVNIVQWKGSDLLRLVGTDVSVSSLQADVEKLSIEERRLDEQIRGMQQKLRGMSEEENIQKWLFFTEEDIECLPCFQNGTLIAIKAPYGTNLEVHDPNEAVDDSLRSYRIVLRSTMGPIGVYLLSRREEKFEEIIVAEAESSLPSISSHNGTIIEKESISNEFNIGGEELQRVSSDASAPRDLASGIMRIVPEVDGDTDYWLISDTDVSITDMWRIHTGEEWTKVEGIPEDDTY